MIVRGLRNLLIMVQAGGDDDVIAMASVDFTESFSQELAKCWDIMVSLLFRVDLTQ